jgi:osmotically-inducible protein OsmY
MSGPTTRVVTLTGSVNWQYQRDEAEFVAGNVLGVAGVQDDIAITAPTPGGDDVAHSIGKAMVRERGWTPTAWTSESRTGVSR